jgi:hypothetical protein
VVELDLIESALGRAGAAEHMVRARLAEAGPDGFRIRGSEGSHRVAVEVAKGVAEGWRGH